MFSTAYSEATKYTRPIISLIRTDDGKVAAGIGSYIVLNQDGWILTAAHILALAHKAQIDTVSRQNYAQAVDRIESDRNLSHKVKKRMVRELPRDDKWITHFSFVFAGSAAQISGQANVDPAADITIARLDTLAGLNVSGFPKFPRAGEVTVPGSSLCTLGFPFQPLAATFDSNANRFDLPAQQNIAFFPSEGIHTRNVNIEDQTSTPHRIVPFIETSSPGLKGQSGGPIVDVHGTVRALQSRTSAYSLDVAPTIKENGKEVKEHQFIQVGMGCAAEHICQFLQTHQVAFERV